MTTPEDQSASSTPLIDEWIAASGEPEVFAEFEKTKRRIEEGTLPSFDNAGDLLTWSASAAAPSSGLMVPAS